MAFQSGAFQADAWQIISAGGSAVAGTAAMTAMASVGGAAMFAQVGGAALPGSAIVAAVGMFAQVGAASFGGSASIGAVGGMIPGGIAALAGYATLGADALADYSAAALTLALASISATGELAGRLPDKRWTRGYTVDKHGGWEIWKRRRRQW